MNYGSIPQSHCVQIGSEAVLSLIHRMLGTLSGKKRPRNEAIHLHLAAKNDSMLSYTPTTLTCLKGVQRNNFDYGN
jgi:hypothetical protein